MARARTSVMALAVVLAASSAARGDVQVELRKGRVTIIARNASVAEVLAEWARVATVTIVNPDKLPTDPVTLTLRDISEHAALETLLRGTSGYIAWPRAVDDPQPSVFGRIAIMPPSTPPAAGVNAATLPSYGTQRSAVASESAPSMAADQSPPETADAADGGAVDDVAGALTVIGSAVQPSVAAAPPTFKVRRMLEVTNPRDFEMPPVTPMRRSQQPGAPTPGRIVRPPEQQDPLHEPDPPVPSTEPSTGEN